MIELNTAENLKNFSEAAGIVGGAGYLAYRVIAGYFRVDLCLSVSTRRLSRPNDDVIAITARLKKGARGSLRLQDVQARVAPEGARPLDPISFQGFESHD